MAKPKAWGPTSAEQALLVDLVTARMPLAVIAKRMGISELKLRRFEKRLLFRAAGDAAAGPARAGHARRRIMACGLGESWRPR
jgi:hypothetical protein